MSKHITFFDIEVFQNDWLVVFDNGVSKTHFWNDNEGVGNYIAEVDYLCGFNINNYDVPVIQAIISGATPEGVKEVNDHIIGGGSPFELPRFKGYFPVCIDLFQDIVPRKSLKEIAGNMGMPIIESSVPFDIERTLTDEEREEVLFYCVSDVDIVKELYAQRESYVKAKFDLCDMVGIEEVEVRRTNASLVGQALFATKQPYEYERYQIPDNINLKYVPDDILEFVTKVDTNNAVDFADKEVKLKKFETDVCGVTAVFGLGGIHASQDKYYFEADDDHALVYQDITSYYPSLILNNGYMSRSAQGDTGYRAFYDKRVQAKADGDTATADACKLVLNTTFGASKAMFNPLFDPIMPISICISGELYIVELMHRLDEVLNDWEIVQLNTDGWILKVARDELDKCNEVIEEFSERTDFGVDTKYLSKIVQKDVNNYIVQFEDGKISTKGGYLSSYPQGDFKGNSLAIVDKSLVEYFINGVLPEDTIGECTDINQFQMIVKAGRTYTDTVWEVNGEEVEVQRVNRVYAVKDESYGRVLKRKFETLEDYCENKHNPELKTACFDILDLSCDKCQKCEKKYNNTHPDGYARAKVQNCPDHAFIDNTNNLDISLLDIDFYVKMAYKRISDMADMEMKGNGMTEKKEAPKKKAQNTKTEPKTKKKEVVNPLTDFTILKEIFAEDNSELRDLMAKAVFARKMSALTKAINEHEYTLDLIMRNNSYAGTQQYKSVLRECCQKVGLTFNCEFPDVNCHLVEQPTSKGMKATFKADARARFELVDIDTGYIEEYYVENSAKNEAIDHACLSAQTYCFRGWFLNSFLVNNAHDDNEEKKSFAMLGGNADGTQTPAKPSKPTKPSATTSQKPQAKAGVKAVSEPPSKASERVVECAKILMDKDSEFITPLLDDYFEVTDGEIVSLKSSVPTPKVIALLSKVEARVAKVG